MNTYIKQLLVVVLALMGASQLAGAAQLHRAEKDKVAYSVSGKFKTAIQFANQSGDVRKIYWLDYEGKRSLYQTLSAGQTYEVDTFLTHPWLITNNNDDALEIYYPDTKTRTILLK